MSLFMSVLRRAAKGAVSLANYLEITDSPPSKRKPNPSSLFKTSEVSDLTKELEKMQKKQKELETKLQQAKKSPQASESKSGWAKLFSRASKDSEQDPEAAAKKALADMKKYRSELAEDLRQYWLNPEEKVMNEPYKSVAFLVALTVTSWFVSSILPGVGYIIMGMTFAVIGRVIILNFEEFLKNMNLGFVVSVFNKISGFFSLIKPEPEVT